MKKVILNEQHHLLQDQERLLAEDFEIVPIPAAGMALQEIKELVKTLRGEEIVIASPIPALMSLLAVEGIPFKVFHNDHREKKELPGGKIIMTVAAEGWEIV